MSDYVERLIGRVVHGRADTRPMIAPRFASPVPDMPSPAEAGTGPQAAEREDAPFQSPPAAYHEAGDSGPLSDRPRPAIGQSARNRRPVRQAPEPSRQPAADPPQQAHPAARPQRPGTFAGSPGTTSSRAVRTEAFVPSSPATPESEHAEPPAEEHGTSADLFLLPPVGGAPARAVAGKPASAEPEIVPSSGSGTPETPTVTVRIGRIEVHSGAPKPAARQKPARTPYRPRMGLEDYLAERREGKR